MTAEQPRGLTTRQVDVLLQPIMHGRVRQQDGNSYLPQQDVRAHLTRVFGFGGWSMHVVETALVHSAPTMSTAKSGPHKGKRDPERIDCAWRATVRLEVRDQHGNHLATYEDAATGDAQNSVPIAAHDLALKSAVSTALKRAATCLGDQFGLSLYNKGSEDAFVRQTLVGATAAAHELEQGNVPTATDEQDPDRAPEVEQATPDEHDHAADDAPLSRETPEERAEHAVERAQQARRNRDRARRADPTSNARARAWDAASEYATLEADSPSREDVMRMIEDELNRREWPAPGSLSAEHWTTIAEHYEEKTDDSIRQQHIVAGVEPDAPAGE